MVMRGLPSARIRWPPPVVIIMNGNPQAVIPTYSCASGSTSSGEPNSFSSGVRNTCVTAISTTPHISIISTAFPTKYGARSRSPRPMLRLKQLAPPIPKRSASDRQEVENGKAMFVAAFPS